MAQPFCNGFSRVDPSIILPREERIKNQSGATRLCPVLPWKGVQVKERLWGVLEVDVVPGSTEKGEMLA